MSDKDDGGAAFPVMPPVDETGRTAVGYPEPEAGISLRDYMAAHAPITFGDATRAYGTTPNLAVDRDRAAFFGVWTYLRYEYADAMLKARKDADGGDA